MKTEYAQVVQLIQAGTDPVAAVARVYQITPTAAHKRLYLLLRHREVYAALGASPTATAAHPRRLMRGVYVPDVDPTRRGRPEDPRTSIRQRLHSLLFEAAIFSPGQWAALASDIRSTDFLSWAGPHDSDFHILSSALCDHQVEDGRTHPERAYKHVDPRPHPEFQIPQDMKDRSDLEHDQWWESRFGAGQTAQK